MTAVFRSVLRHGVRLPAFTVVAAFLFVLVSEPAFAQTVGEMASAAGSAVRSGPVAPVNGSLVDGATSALAWAGLAVVMISAQGVWAAVRANIERTRRRKAAKAARDAAGH
ncbi:hypothetical protein [Pseudoxanthobacter sp.]|uniref:hypothetical protein n=1 Tax=Pseudoxanthobacter sp. TaxID=1925742 RepID=UPI002FE3547F